MGSNPDYFLKSFLLYIENAINFFLPQITAWAVNASYARLFLYSGKGHYEIVEVPLDIPKQ